METKGLFDSSLTNASNSTTSAQNSPDYIPAV
jgi:hypothetical protein